MDKDWQKKYWDMASGLVEATQKRAEPVVRALVKQGEIAAERAEKAVDELLTMSQSNRKTISKMVREETKKAVDRFGLVRQKEIAHLERKVERLERKLAGDRVPAPAGKSGAAGSRRAKKKTAAEKKSAAGTTAAKKATGKKTTAKKAAKATAKKAAKKATPARTAATDTAAKKTTPPAGQTDQ